MRTSYAGMEYYENSGGFCMRTRFSKSLWAQARSFSLHCKVSHFCRIYSITDLSVPYVFPICKLRMPGTAMFLHQLGENAMFLKRPSPASCKVCV